MALQPYKSLIALQQESQWQSVA